MAKKSRKNLKTLRTKTAFKELSLKQTKKNFLEGERLTISWVREGREVRSFYPAHNFYQV